MNSSRSPRASKLESYGARVDTPWPLGAKKGTKGDDIYTVIILLNHSKVSVPGATT